VINNKTVAFSPSRPAALRGQGGVRSSKGLKWVLPCWQGWRLSEGQGSFHPKGIAHA
jgi:hypothetical protein